MNAKKKIRRILLLSLGLTGYISLLPRGGSKDFLDIVDTDYIKRLYDIDEGVRYLDDQRLKNIIHDLYAHKRKGKIIYITATALCHLTNRYGQTFLALPFAMGDFGLTNAYQTVRKVVVTIFLGGVGPLWFIGSPLSLAGALVLGTSGLRLAFTNLDFLATSAIDITEGIKPRIPGISEVVVVNNRDKMIMSNPMQENKECWLPDQRFSNPTCTVKPTQIPDTIDSVLPDLNYEDTVNMQDITGLDRVKFTDQCDLGQTKSDICNLRKGKEVNFLDKFGDSGPISETEGWDTGENEVMVPKRKYLRTRNKP